MVREGLRRILEANPHLRVVGESGRAAEALELAAALQPDVILLELNLDGELNTEIIPALLDVAPTARAILVTAIDEQQVVQLAVQMGVVGVVPKTATGATLCKAVEKVCAGEVWIDRMMMASVLGNLTRTRASDSRDPEAQRIRSLSEREREVIGLIGQGMRNREIAQRLSISEITVRHHLSSIYSKLSVGDRLELTIYAYRNGLAALPS
jgi:DNA-binding NarL/FixJ family response regulator